MESLLRSSSLLVIVERLVVLGEFGLELSIERCQHRMPKTMCEASISRLTASGVSHSSAASTFNGDALFGSFDHACQISVQASDMTKRKNMTYLRAETGGKRESWKPRARETTSP